MQYQEILALLSYAGDHGHAVRITIDGAAEVVGVPTSVDDHITAHEVYLRPAGADDTEIAISLGVIRSVQLL
jgi:hypothetical protein